MPTKRTRKKKEPEKRYSRKGILSSDWLIANGALGRIDEDTALAVPAFYCGVNLIATTIAKMPLHVYRRLPDGGKERVRDHPVARLFNEAPNLRMTPVEFKEMI